MLLASITWATTLRQLRQILRPFPAGVRGGGGRRRLACVGRPPGLRLPDCLASWQYWGASRGQRGEASPPSPAAAAAAARGSTNKQTSVKGERTATSAVKELLEWSRCRTESGLREGRRGVLLYGEEG